MKLLSYILTLSATVLTLFIGTAYADVLELKDGTVLKGQYMGGTQSTVRFQVENDMQVVQRQDIVALTFSNDAAPKATTPPKSSAAAPAKTTKAPSSVAAGTTLLVRTAEDITTQNKSAGQRFTANLEGNLMAGEVMIAPSGTTVYGKVVNAQKGGIGARKPILELTLTDIMIDGQLKPLVTSILTGEGPKGGAVKKIAKGAAVGALVDGSKGAETGAKVGAGIAVLGGGKHAGLKTGSLIEFTLQQDLSL